MEVSNGMHATATAPTIIQHIVHLPSFFSCIFSATLTSLSFFLRSLYYAVLVHLLYPFHTGKYLLAPMLRDLYSSTGGFLNSMLHLIFKSNFKKNQTDLSIK